MEEEEAFLTTGKNDADDEDVDADEDPEERNESFIPWMNFWTPRRIPAPLSRVTEEEDEELSPWEVS